MLAAWWYLILHFRSDPQPLSLSLSLPDVQLPTLRVFLSKSLPLCCLISKLNKKKKTDAILPLVIQKKFRPLNLNNSHMRQERTTLLTASCWWAGSKFIIPMLFYGTLSSYDGLAAFRATLLLLLSRRYMRRWVTHRLDKLLCWLLIDVQLRVQICLNLISFNLLRACCVIRHRTHEIRLQNQPKVICFISHDIHRKLLAVGGTNRNWS